MSTLKVRKAVKEGKRIIAYYQIGILFPDGKKIIKPRCTIEEVFETYFLNLNKYLDKNYSAEELFELYKKSFKEKNIKVQINYIDSWGHKWTGKCAWPRESKFIDYLNKRLND